MTDPVAAHDDLKVKCFACRRLYGWNFIQSTKNTNGHLRILTASVFGIFVGDDMPPQKKKDVKSFSCSCPSREK